MAKRIEDLNLTDDFLFAKVMSDEEICRRVLETLLGLSIRKVSLPQPQKTIDLQPDSKGIRLDIYADDEDGTIYNCEMQRGRKKHLPKRSRYYQGTIDLDAISKGNPYDSLKKSYVIFICTFDPFQEGRHIYTFQNTCLESPGLHLHDGTTKVFFNIHGTMEDVDWELKEFLSYLEDTTDEFVGRSNSHLIREVHRRVTEVKQSKEMEAEYMTLLQRDRENLEQGIEQGIEQGEKRMAALTKILLDQNRTDELMHAVLDESYREQLYRRLNITI